MITLSLCMIVKNEAQTLARCLDSVAGVVDEIVIVDTGSTDQTRQIAADYTDKLYDFEWIDDFSAARNFSFDQASMDYILWLDADDVLLPEDAAALAALKHTLPPGTDTVMMRYNTGFDALGRVTFSCLRGRLSRRAGRFRWHEPVHEYLEVGPRKLTADIAITHAKPEGRPDGGRNLRIYQSLLARGQTLSPRGLYYYARELFDHGRYAESAARFTDFLDSGLGWVEDNIAACLALSKCYRAEKKPEPALAAALRSLHYDAPRAELCCQLGALFREAGRHDLAIFWYTLALGRARDSGNGGFREPDCWGFIPCLELAVCYDFLGLPEKAAEFNERAAEFKPDAPAVLHNRRYFEARKRQQVAPA